MFVRAIGIASAFMISVVPMSAGSAPSLADAAGRYQVAPAGSSIHFAIGKTGGGSLAGAFGRFKGDIHIDGGNIASSQVDFTIYPESVSTGEGRTDAFLKSDAVFDAAREHEIRFRSTSVKRTGDSSAVVSGPLTARGRTGTESFDVELKNVGKGMISFRVTGKILRSRYGMDVGTPIYSNVVVFDMTLAGKRG
ncbi:YceI family protein [Rhizobiaceae sp. 2RAB30]